MAYTAEISRSNPSCFLFIIDQSGSMADKYVSIGIPKAQAVSDVINKIINQIVIKCAKSEGIRDYYHIGIIGYGSGGVSSAFKGELAGRDLVKISELSEHPARIEDRIKKMSDGMGGIIEAKAKFRVWIDPIADGGTPMTAAFKKANTVLSSWLQEHPNSFPPVVIHVTDGETTDGDPSIEMAHLTNLSSSDGNVVLFNLHTNARTQSQLSALTFPGSETLLPDQNAQLLYNTASTLPDFIKRVAENEFQLQLTSDAKAFVMNGDIDVIVTAIEIGTRSGLQLMR